MNRLDQKEMKAMARVISEMPLEHQQAIQDMVMCAVYLTMMPLEHPKWYQKLATSFLGKYIARRLKCLA